MVSFVESKKVNWSFVKKILRQSEEKNHWTNFGPVSRFLENRIKKLLNVDYSVVACASGTAALHALVNLYSYLQQKNLTWVISSFGFPCTTMGPIRNVIVDCNEAGMLDLGLLNHLQFDGMIVTNPFGTANSLDLYSKYCKDNNKLLIFDCAAAMFNSKMPNAIISFHHTKPWGFGEGGCAILEKKHEAPFRSLLNFGLETNQPVGNYATNGKMSDISAAFILDRLNKINYHKKKYNCQYDRVEHIAIKHGFTVLGQSKSSFSNSVPLLADRNIKNLENPYVVIKKYYKPLLKTRTAVSIYNKIVNFPSHADIELLSNSDIENCLNMLLIQN